MQIGYCTNVHAGVGLEQTQANLSQHAVEVKRLVSPDAPMPVGLWLSNATAAELMQAERLPQFAAWLADEGLLPYTLNGFPYGDFHQPVVKHRVYEPTWSEPARLQYTLSLIDILHRLLPAGAAGSISTLPIQWGSPRPEESVLQAAAENLRAVADRLAGLELETGRFICLCIEPEPGCLVQRTSDMIAWFEDYLLPGSNEEIVRRYLQVCHDVCHAAVMFEPQADVLRQYQAAGIGVGKVQVSSAVRAPLADYSGDERTATLDQLRSFAEDRYLHQTVVAAAGARDERFFEDLPLALAESERGELLDAEWRIHFHVPIYLERFGRLQATREQIEQCLAAARQHAAVEHYEVETYAWGVLPDALKQPTLAAGIAAELNWFRELAGRMNP